MKELLNMGQIEQQARARIRGDIATLKARAAEMETIKSKALEAEDAETYNKADFTSKSIAAQLDKQRAELDHLEQAHSYTDDNVLMAWADYADEYNGRFAEALAEYEAARYELAQKFRDLITMQGKALCVRESMHRLLHPADVLHFTTDSRLAALDMIPNDAHTRARTAPNSNSALVDAIYFCAHDDLPRGAYSTVAQIANGEPIDPTKPRAPLGEFAQAFGGYSL